MFTLQQSGCNIYVSVTAMVVSMEAEMIPRPASATAELSRPQPELLSEMEHTLSVKTKVKKGKTGKELKK